MNPVYRRNPAIEAAPMQGESILFDPAARRFCLLNGTAAVLWERLATPATIVDLAAELRHSFDVPEPSTRVEDDVHSILQRFTDLTLVTVDPA